MSYPRVIPRDLFNEANLLKCYGQLSLKMDVLAIPNIRLEHNGHQQYFQVHQHQYDGSLTLRNIYLVKIDDHGQRYRYDFHRPLNSREPWPLYCEISDDRETAVFDDNGELAEGFLEFLREP